MVVLQTNIGGICIQPAFGAKSRYKSVIGYRALELLCSVIISHFQTEGFAVYGGAGAAGSVGGAAWAGGAVAEADSSRPWLSVRCRPPGLRHRPAGRAALGTAE